jgi:hypothetical protein
MQPGSAVESLWFTMPYVPGESLRNRLAREPQLPLRDAVRIALEVADALGYAHGQGLVHRDVKPENILLSGDHCVIADFGLGRALDAAGGERLTETGITFGTPLYMSPEQASADVPSRSRRSSPRRWHARPPTASTTPRNSLRSSRPPSAPSRPCRRSRHRRPASQSLEAPRGRWSAVSSALASHGSALPERRGVVILLLLSF